MDAILVNRYEYKYLLSPAQAPEVRRFLLRYCTPDEHTPGEAWYGIQSLYLDTSTFHFYKQSAEKALERMKLRVRAYALGGGPVKLEVKRRVNDVVNKRSLLLCRKNWNRMRLEGLRVLPAETVAGLGEFAFLVESLRAAPKLLVEYERQALYSDIDDYVRVTFDRRIRCQPTEEWSVEGRPRAWRLVDDPAPGGESPYVMELKFKVLPPVWLHDLVTAFRLTRHGFSKYARGVRHTILARETSWDLRSAWRAAWT